MAASPATHTRPFLFSEGRVRGRPFDSVRGPLVRAFSAQATGHLISALLLSLGGVGASDPESGAFAERSWSNVWVRNGC